LEKAVEKNGQAGHGYAFWKCPKVGLNLVNLVVDYFNPNATHEALGNMTLDDVCSIRK
jgi:hypothetical protein